MAREAAQAIVAAAAADRVAPAAAVQRLARFRPGERQVGHAFEQAGRAFDLPKGRSVVHIDVAVGVTVAVAVDLKNRRGKIDPVADLGRPLVHGGAGEGPSADEGGVQGRQVDAVAWAEIGDLVVADVRKAAETEGIRSLSTGQEIVAASPIQRVVAGSPGQRVVPRSANQLGHRIPLWTKSFGLSSYLCTQDFSILGYWLKLSYRKIVVKDLNKSMNERIMLGWALI
ncbi:hypothetical protein M2351_008831 [Azospirillum canadense]|nr:hypothetical protein [Azospirillum canadense]